MGTGGAEFNNLLDKSHHVNPSAIDFVAHAGAMGATAVKAGSIAELEDHLAKSKTATRPYVIVLDTDPYPSTPHGGTWWEVGVPEVSERATVNAARDSYEANRKQQRAD
jgi:3D-(3,5/4)-trihydroxycyclohexane-1,2-dione acylhydrolase (decyclizing)